ncbi:hypothetical protein BSKO_12913 [Bryopsis sp. KO-2023]|nr:hypothetical protein BSKO_12913 [Bryopsis sp. KO-2023]
MEIEQESAPRSGFAPTLPATLDAGSKVIAEYIWLGGSGTDLRSLAKVLETAPTRLEHLPDWHVDGSCSGLALPDDYYVYLKPQAYYPDPFRGGQNVLVLCGTYVYKEASNSGQASDLLPHATNNRFPCKRVMELASTSQPTFSVDQEYTITNPSTSWIVSSSVGSIPVQGAPSFCGTGSGVVSGREVSESFLVACLHAGLKISTSSALACRGQWVYHLGPCEGIAMADELWVSRYVLLRSAEIHRLNVTFDPEPVPSNNLQPLCCSVEFSTNETRTPETGIEVIATHIEALKENHIRHVVAYGKGYLQRLSIPHQDVLRQRCREFTSGYGNKATSIMIPHSTRMRRCGHYIDQRPASNMDPYLVTALLVSTTLGVPLRAAAGENIAGVGGGSEYGLGGGGDVEDGDLDDEDAGVWEEAFINEIAMHEPMIPDTPPLSRCFTSCLTQKTFA